VTVSTLIIAIVVIMTMTDGNGVGRHLLMLQATCQNNKYVTSIRKDLKNRPFKNFIYIRNGPFPRII
jgi:hypothetical protein